MTPRACYRTRKGQFWTSRLAMSTLRAERRGGDSDEDKIALPGSADGRLGRGARLPFGLLVSL